MSWRGVVRWALWSPRRLLLVLVGSLVLVAAIGSYAGGASSMPARRGGERSASMVRAAALASSRAPRSRATSSSFLPNGAGAAAVAFVRAWARPGLPESQWFAALRPLATPAYANVVQDEEPWIVTSHRVTGPPSGRGDGEGASVTVPTDAGPELVMLVHQGSTWLVTDVEPAPSG
jgi:hypothetical protein